MDPGLTVIHLGIRLGIGENRHFLAFEIFKKKRNNSEIFHEIFHCQKKTVIFTTLVSILYKYSAVILGSGAQVHVHHSIAGLGLGLMIRVRITLILTNTSLAILWSSIHSLLHQTRNSWTTDASLSMVRDEWS